MTTNTETTTNIDAARAALAAFDAAGPATVLQTVPALAFALRSLISETPSAEEWTAAMDAERALQVAKGYDDVHDREHGPAHLLTWAIDHARRGRALEASTMIREVLRSLTSEPPTDDERAGIERLAEGVIIAFVQAQARAAQDLTQHQSITTIPAVADRIMASPEWRNRHRGPITDEAVDAACEAWAAEPLSWPGEHPADAGRRYMRAALEAAEAARTNHTDGSTT